MIELDDLRSRSDIQRCSAEAVYRDAIGASADLWNSGHLLKLDIRRRAIN